MVVLSSSRNCKHTHWPYLCSGLHETGVLCDARISQPAAIECDPLASGAIVWAVDLERVPIANADVKLSMRREKICHRSWVTNHGRSFAWNLRVRGISGAAE